MGRPDGFAGQRLCVVPRPLVAAALTRAPTRRLLVTDAGVFTRARDHLRRRPSGSPEAVWLLCTAGSGWVDVDGTRTDVTAGTCVVLPPGVPHAYGADHADPWTIWWWHTRGSDAGDLVRGLDGPPGRAGSVVVRTPERAVALADEIVTTLERGQQPAHLAAAAGAAWHLATWLAAQRTAPDRGTPVDRALRHLDERLDRDVGVAELAALVGVSPSHLGALVRAATGGGVLAYRTAARMARARHLLDTTDAPVAEVARAVGYDDPLYFSRRFRRTHGTSPTAYRAEHKG